MKKFLIFLVSIVCVVSIGLVTYYFLRNDEVISIKNKEIYCNIGDIITLDDIGIEVKKANPKTTYDYNAGGLDVTKYVNFDADKGYYVVGMKNAGDVDLKIGTSNSKFPELLVKLHIGNGAKETPYYISNAEELARIGNIYNLSAHYTLIADIDLKNANIAPIGSENGVGFAGTFNGNNHSISNLTLSGTDYASVGLFYSINAGAKVNNLTLDNFNINGAYTNAGVLAGTIAGEVSKVGVINSVITNNSADSFNGALAGVYTGSTLKMTYADNVDFVGNSTVTSDNVVVGGLIGKVEETTIQAVYANNGEINMASSNGIAGGLIGEMVVGNNTGSVQQSYANTVSTFANYAGFINTISSTADFDATQSNMLTHLIGNIAIINKDTIADEDLVKVVPANYFSNFKNVEKSLYLVCGYKSVAEALNNEFVFYSIDRENTLWDTEFVWEAKLGAMPVLRMGITEPSNPSGDYFRKDLTEQTPSSGDEFKNIFSADVENASIKLLADADLTDGYSPVAVKNSVVDGNNKTITINLKNATANNEYLGLFSVVDNSTIKKLTIKVVGVEADAANAGALAGLITSTNAISTSTIENVTVIFENAVETSAVNFGGLAGEINNAKVTNVTVSGLNTTNANIVNIGAISAKSATSNFNTVVVNDVVLSATTNVGGLIAENSSSIINAEESVQIVYNSNVANAKVGGVVATNAGEIKNVTANVKVNINTANTTIYVGGVAAENNGTITDTTINGEGIYIDGQNGLDAKVYAGGIVAVNNANIKNVNNLMVRVGTFANGKDYVVGGVAAINNGTISQVVNSSNVYGNVVAGVVAEMNNSNAVIDQVLVGEFNAETKTVARKEIKGDKLVAGVAADFRNGKISNVQASSNLFGVTDKTKTSLLVLIFPNQASLTYATVDSTMSGNGAFYRDSWRDFASYSNKADYGLGGTASGESSFNIYSSRSFCGIMNNIVINGVYDDNVKVSQGMGTVNAGIIPIFGDTYNGTNFVKVVDGFNTVAQFKGSFTFNSAYNSTYNAYRTSTKTLSFDIGTSVANGNVWVDSGSGICLTFICE